MSGEPGPDLDKRLRKIEKDLRELGRQVQRPPSLREARVDAERAVDLAAGDGDGPVLAGPWMGELGFELLYWIPFLNWAVERRPDLAGRLAVMSRGGVAPWYRHLTDRYADAFAAVDPATFLERRGHRMKQVEVTEFEQELAGGAARALGLERPALLHPSAMYLSMLALAREEAVGRFLEFARPAPFARPDRGALAAELPDEYVAVKFYFNNSFPDEPANRRFVEGVLGALTARTHVVLLNTGMSLDDHFDFDARGRERVVSLDHLMTPADNLAVQSVAIAHARAYVGTYGGLSYVAPFYGVPSLSFHSTADQMIRRHLDLAGAMFSAPELGDYVVLPRDAMGLVNLIAALPAEVA
jgi:hypothetical protein